VDNGSNGASDPGDIVTYTYVVTNTGDTQLTAVTVVDPKPGLSAIGCNWPAAEGVLAAAGEANDSVTCTATYALTQADVDTGKVENTAMVTGQPPAGGEVGDADSAVVDLSALGEIGDLVWRDTNRNGRQDPGEPGVAGARIRLTNLDTSRVFVTTTNSSGRYLFGSLVSGNYRVAIDPTSVSGGLTTPSSYTFFLASGSSRLNADFGLTAALPVTGVDADRLTALGVFLIGSGILAVIVTRRRELETG
jgi:uncharacterized repeat protein (TIGR01451 family)